MSPSCCWAKAVHDLGPRAKQPFVAINCGAIPENLLESELFGHERGAFTGAVKQTIGKIESAHKGTLCGHRPAGELLPEPLQPEFGRGIRGFTEHATAALNAHDWPGNVRELENRLQRAVVMAERRLIDAADLELAPPAQDFPDLDLRSARLRAERDVIREALARSNNTMSVAARLLGVSRPTLYGLMEAHGIGAETNGPAEGAAAVTETTMQND